LYRGLNLADGGLAQCGFCLEREQLIQKDGARFGLTALLLPGVLAGEIKKVLCAGAILERLNADAVRSQSALHFTPGGTEACGVTSFATDLHLDFTIYLADLEI